MRVEISNIGVVRKGRPEKALFVCWNRMFWKTYAAPKRNFAPSGVANTVVILICVLLVSAAYAFGGASVPWTTYEAENMATTGTLLGPSYAVGLQASEASGRQAVQLSSTGQYVQFTNQSSANSLVVRYSVPDSSNGTGTDYTISLYTNGVFVGKLLVTSKYSWLYGNYPFTNNPTSGSPRNFYDEARTNGLSLAAGTVVRLERDSTDTASSYVIDLVDVENVAGPLSQPGNSLSITSYGADGTGATDSTLGLSNCVNAAASQGKSVWLPSGTYKITGTITLPSNLTIQGAGMWYSTLVGDPTLYATPSRRILINGNGNNIHLADFAITGKLNYRNDNEANDGLVGTYGTGSTISRVWVEHTKVGAWIINSQGLVVDSCRFRDTIADGINIDVGMQSCVVTNSTARGTGDDCFAIWPATYTSQTYTPGFNIITHCTAQCPFLANGGAIYGAISNRIDNCLFQDMPYGCGILISTTFPVGINTFGGITVAQQCDLNRCGGYDPGYQWRAAVQLCLDNYEGISGINLNNLDITNSVSDGLSVIGTNTLANAVMSSVSIPNYGIGTSGRNGLWARSDAHGSLTVSNCAIVEYKDDSPHFTFNFATSTIPITVQTSPTGLSFSVDATNYTSAKTFNWQAGSGHTIAVTTPQSGGAGTQYVWGAWSDGGASLHTIAPTTATTYTASFITQYDLTMSSGTGGSVTPASLWTNSGASINISASAANGYTFANWTGTGAGSYSGTSNSATITVNGPISETASFVANISITVESSPPGTSFTVDGTSYSAAQVFSWVPGAAHTIATTSPQSGGTGTQYVWTAWSDAGGISHVVAPTNNTTFRANFATQYYLTMNAGTGGGVSPASGWTNSGATLNISATTSNGFSFGGWSGSGSGSYSGSGETGLVTMNGPITEIASFTTPKTIGLSGNLSFGYVLVGNSDTLFLSLSNADAIAALTISGISYPDGFSGSWSGVLEAGSSTNIAVLFIPADETNYSGALTVNSDATSGTNTLPIFGAGVLEADHIPPAQNMLGATISANGSVTVSYLSSPGFPYHLETATSLAPPSWIALPGSVTNATGTVTTFTDLNASAVGKFYRSISP